MKSSRNTGYYYNKNSLVIAFVPVVVFICFLLSKLSPDSEISYFFFLFLFSQPPARYRPDHVFPSGTPHRVCIHMEDASRVGGFVRDLIDSPPWMSERAQLIAAPAQTGPPRQGHPRTCDLSCAKNLTLTLTSGSPPTFPLQEAPYFRRLSSLRAPGFELLSFSLRLFGPGLDPNITTRAFFRCRIPSF